MAEIAFRTPFGGFMSKTTVTLAAGSALFLCFALAGCGVPHPDSATSAAATPAAATTAVAANLPVKAATPIDPSTDLGTATKPGDGKLKLDIKYSGGDSLYGDPASGKAVFAQCMTCHSKEPGVNIVGPSLHGIIGRHSGIVPDFSYSDANKGSGKVWSEQELYVYLENPQKEIPGTYMTYTGVKDPQKRADVIAFLQENTK
jgi:cytochrome c